MNSNLNPLTNFTGSCRNIQFKDIFPWYISQMITKTIPGSMRIVITMQWNGASCFEFIGKPMETETTTWSEFGKAIIEQILVSKEINKSKRAGLWESQSGKGNFLSRKVNYLSNVVWDWRKIKTGFTRTISSTRIG